MNKGAKKRMFPGHRFVKMYSFAIDFECEMPYPLAPAQGRGSASLIFDNLAISTQQSAKPNPNFTQPRAAVPHESSEPYAKLRLIAGVYANLGCLGMNPLKPTPIWDAQGGRGGRAERA
jgi:hypothetical protein